jgi:hypothetical protein
MNAMCKKSTFLWTETGWCVARQDFEILCEVRMVVVSTRCGNDEQVFVHGNRTWGKVFYLLPVLMCIFSFLIAHS